MKVKDINGDYDTMTVEFEDGREVEISGELLYRKFVAYENSIRKWKKPEGEPISDSERKEIIDAVTAADKDAAIKITFETYRPPTEEEKEAGWKAFLERIKNE